MELQKNDLLRRARRQQGWSQEDLATKLGVSPISVIRWERGETPNLYNLGQLCTLFNMTAQQLGFISEPSFAENQTNPFYVFDPTIPLPYSQSLAGRGPFLLDLKHHLANHHNTILTGLPGVGKTALTLALAYDADVRKQFSDGVLWANVGQDSHMMDELGRWGKLLGVSERTLEKAQHPSERKKVIRDAMSQRHLLLVIDNIWDAENAQTFFLGGSTCAHLLTTRLVNVATQLKQSVEDLQIFSVEELNTDDGVELLKFWVPELGKVEPQKVRDLVEIVGGLPVALTLMGGYLLRETYSGQVRRMHQALQNLLNPQTRLQLSRDQEKLSHRADMAPETPSSLETTIRMSDEVLDTSERRALRALSALSSKPNSFSEEAALSITELPDTVIDALVDATLVTVDRRAGLVNQTRYTLHQTIKVDPFVKTGGRADVRATLLLFLSRYGLFLQLFYCFSG